MRNDNEIEGPCYVVSSNGYRESVSYEDGWCYGKSEYIGSPAGTRSWRDLVKIHIRERMTERNGLPCYYISDHGNVSRVRCVRLRKLTPTTGGTR